MSTLICRFRTRVLEFYVQSACCHRFIFSITSDTLKFKLIFASFAFFLQLIVNFRLRSIAILTVQRHQSSRICKTITSTCKIDGCNDRILKKCKCQFTENTPSPRSSLVILLIGSLWSTAFSTTPGPFRRASICNVNVYVSFHHIYNYPNFRSLPSCSPLLALIKFLRASLLRSA